jgi:tRNA threonylcarbamoyladenosine biosynthesis protein TsaB
MRLLALDTATEALSVALMDESGVIADRFEVIGRGHAERVLPWVQALMADAGWPLSSLDAIAVGRGPGAFTGVRIGVSAAQGLAFGLNVPLIGVSDLAAVAAGAADRATQAGMSFGGVLVALDARMGEVYAAFVRHDQGRVLLEWEALLSPGALQARAGGLESLVLAGHGFSAHPTLAEAFSGSAACYTDELPSARVVARLAAADYAAGHRPAAEALEPVYLRDDVASRATPKT